MAYSLANFLAYIEVRDPAVVLAEIKRVIQQFAHDQIDIQLGK